MKKAFTNILVVVKQTAYDQYLQLKAQGKAPVAVRWERLRNRNSVHKQCVDDVTRILEDIGIKYAVVGREELHRGIIQDKDLLIAVGGDGTILNTASFLDDSIPVLGVNSDPTRPEEEGVTKLKDERRSTGALCACSATNVHEFLPRVLYGEVPTTLRSRIQCLIRSTYTETRLPPALNDILIAHPIPAAVSRFRLSLCRGNAAPSYKPVPSYQEVYSINVWSSGIWVCTATGSTAAMHAAGGFEMDLKSEELQYMVREHLTDDNCVNDKVDQKKLGHGRVTPDQMMNIRWNSQYGCVYADGSHLKHDLNLGDEVKIDGHAPYLQIFQYQPKPKC